MKRLFLYLFLLVSQLNYGQDDFSLAEKYYRDGAFEKATLIFKNLHDKNPYNTTYLKRLILCYQGTSKFTDVDLLIRNRLLKNKNLHYLHVELGYNYERQKEPVTAKKHYDIAINAIEKSPNQGNYIARLFKENNLLDYAILAYEKTMLYNPSTNYKLQIALIYGEQGKYENMFQAYVDLVDSNESYAKTVQRFSSKYLTDNSKNNVLFKKLIIKKSISNPKNVWNQLLSWLFMQQKEYGKAFIQEKALFNRDPKYLINILNLGHIAFENKKFKIANSCFEFTLINSTSDSQKLNASLYLIKTAVLTQDLSVESLFQSVFTKYGKTNATLKIQIEYANYLTFYKRDSQKSIAILNEALKSGKSKFDRADIKLKLGDIYVFMGQFNKALIYFSQVQTSIKNHPLAQEARFKVARTSYYKNDFKWALAQSKILKSSTTQLIANDALELFLLISENQPKDSVPTGLSLYAKADLLGYQNKNQEALEILQSVLIKYKGQKIEDDALFKQAKLYHKTTQSEKAIVNYSKIIALDKEGILVDDSLYQLAEIYNNQLNNTEKASEYYQKIIFDHPSSIYLVDARKKYRKLRGDTVQ